MRANAFVIALAFFFAALAGVYWWMHVTGPSDGTRLQPSERVWTREGVRVTALASNQDGLQTGDVVVAVDGRSMADWVAALFAVNVPRPQWQIGQTVMYTVERGGNRVNVPVTLGTYPIAAIFAEHWGLMLFGLLSQLIGTFVFWRRPDDASARLLFLWSWSGVHNYAWSMGLTVGDIVGGAGYWIYRLTTPGAWILYWACLLHFALDFPTRTLTRFPIVTKLIYVVPYALTLLFLAVTFVAASNRLEWLNTWSIAEYAVLTVYLTVGVFAGFLRSRALGDPIARAQLKWIAFGATIAGAAGLILWATPYLFLGAPLVSANVMGLIVLSFPIAIAVAILRHRLFDIDIVIRKTLTYSTLTATLLVFYLASVVLLQQVTRVLTGQQSSEIVTIASTLGIAALFNPLRHRVQDAIDRRFYRKKYDAARVLAEFAATARDEVELEKLTARLVEVVQETMQPTSVSVWLRRR
ncbi:MAG: hypothetical protein HY782_25050 [Chloroflexi bacterium]|nr:hypothetical protein [Chloroflexota bacterium]